MAHTPITRESLNDPEGVHADRMRTRLRARLALVAELGCRGLIPAERAKGYAVGVKAAAELLDRYDPKPREAVAVPISIDRAVLILDRAHEHARAGLPSHGVTLHLADGDGTGR